MLVLREGELLPRLERTVVAVGVFDGVHRGHQHLVAQARAIADEIDGPVAVAVFDRHPNTVVRPGAVKRLLSDLTQRLGWLEAAGVDLTYVLRFDEERSLESPNEFVRAVLVETLHAAALVSGEDHHFGHRAQGDTALMAQLGATHGIKVSSLPMLRTPEGEVISSDMIRKHVVEGDVVGAAALLGRPYELHGIVEHGDHRGRELGFPTANLAVAGDMALPRNGVYAGWYQRPNGDGYPAAINIGRRPTFYDDGLLLIEAYLLDFDGDLYGERPRLGIHVRLRDEVKFDDPASLIAQLDNDVEATRRLLA